MDLILLIDNLYEINNTHQLSSEDNKTKWLNLLNILQQFDNSFNNTQNNLQKDNRVFDKNSEKEIFLKNSNLFLLCSSKEQEEYLLYLQTKLNQRGLSLKQGITEELMIESGIAYSIILLLEKQFNSIIKKQYRNTQSKQDSQSQSLFKSIHKVLNYDYFAENNISENIQKYENILKYEEASNNTINNKNSNDDELLPYLLGQQDDYVTDSPIKIQMNHMNNSKNTHKKDKSFQRNLFNTHSQYSKSKSLRHDNYNKNGEEIKECFLKEDFILNLSILFSRFFESFEKTSDLFTLGFSPCLSHYFLNLISQKKFWESNQEQNKHVHMSILNEKSSQNSVYQNIFTPQKISTPDAIRKIEEINYTISSNKENIKQQPFTSSFLQSNVQSFNPQNNLFEKKQKNIQYPTRHSIDHTGITIVNSPKQYKKIHKKNERYDSCIQNGNTQFEESQLLINQLDIEKRRYQQYSLEQSKQIQEMNYLYNDLKNKYEDLLEQSISRFQSFAKQQETLQKSDILQYSTVSQTDDNITNYDQSGANKSKAEQIQIQTEQSQLKTSECNPIMIQTLPRHRSFLIENDSDITRRQIHNDILDQSFLFQSQNQIIEQSDSLSSESSQVSLPLFNYVKISDIWNSKLKQSFKSNKSTDLDKDDKPYRIKDIILITISIIIITSIVYLILFY